jgi:leucyl aminopeptidase (aminopeptidase T)
MKSYDASLGVKVLVETCLNVIPDENVLIVTDTNQIELARFFVEETKRKEAEVILSTMTPQSAHGVEPPAPISAAMKKADVIMMLTTYSLAHTQARKDAQKKGARILSLEGYNFRILESKALQVDFLMMKPIVEEIALKISRAEEVEVTSKIGTDIRMKLGGRKAHSLHNICHDPGTMGSPPDIEVYIAPIEDTAQGVVCIDGAIILPEVGLIDKPVKITFESGNVVKINGGFEAKRLRNILESYCDPEMYRLAELGIGLNPNAKLVGIPLIDEGVLGTAHIALGINHTFGGTITNAKAHLDCIFRSPTIRLDGDPIMNQGILAHAYHERIL